jgi:hypothetical protein
MIKKFTEIAKAWIAAANPTPEQQIIADHRSSICNGCDARTFKDIPGIGDFYVCSDCGCPLQKKIFAPHKKSCPRDKWLK